jgi:hypothetical protein
MPAYTRVTLSDITNRLSEKVGNNTTFWTAEEKKDAINEALCVWQVLTGEFTRGFTLAATSGTVFYQTPHQIASINRILHNGTPLTPITLWELDMAYSGWQGTAGTPLYWAPVGLEIFAVYPQPTTGALRIEGFTENVRLLADGDFLQVGDEELTRLLDYAHHYLSIKEGIPEITATMGGFKRFLKAASLRNARLLAVAFFRKVMGLVREERERLFKGMEGNSPR